jgi:hypothetical protein
MSNNKEAYDDLLEMADFDSDTANKSKTSSIEE